MMTKYCEENCKRRRLRGIFFGLLVLMLTACAMPLSGYAPADRVYRLTPLVSAAPQRALAHLYLPGVQVSPALDTARITLVKPGYQQDFIANSRWPERLSVYMQSVMLDAFSRSGGFLSVSDQLLGNDNIHRLLLRVSAFHAEYPPAGQQGTATVVLGMEAILVREKDQRMLGQYRYDIRKEHIPVSIGRIVAAMNQALGEGVDLLVRDAGQDLPVLQ